MDGILASYAQGQCASPGLQYSTYPYQVPDGHSGWQAHYGGPQQYMPAGWFGNVLGQFAPPIGIGFGGTFGNPQSGVAPGSQYGNVNPFAGGIQSLQLGQGWLGQPVGMGLGGGIGVPQFGSNLGGIGNQLSGSIPFAVPQQAAQQVAQQAAQVGQLVGQQIAQQAAQQAAQQVACHAAHAAQQAAFQAAQAAQHIGQQGAQQVALLGGQQLGPQQAQQAALQAAQAAQQVAQQAAQQAAQQVGQQAAQAAQLVGYQVAQQAALACNAQQAYNPWNQLLASQQWAASQAGYGNPWWQNQPYGNIGAGLRAINPFNPYSGAAPGNQVQFTPAPRFSFA